MAQCEKARLSIILEDEEEENESIKEVIDSSLEMNIEQEKEKMAAPGEEQEIGEKAENVTVEAIIEVCFFHLPRYTVSVC